MEEKLFLNSLVPWIRKGSGKECLFLLVGIIPTIITNKKKLMKMRKKGCSFFEDIPSFLKTIWEIFTKTTFIGFIFYAVFFISATAALAEYKICSRIEAFIEDGSDAFLDDKRHIAVNEYESVLQEEGKETIDDEVPYQSAENKEVIDDTASYQNTEDEEILDEVNNEYEHKLHLLDEDKIVQKYLSEEERNELFFVGGDYEIFDWDDDLEIEYKVRLKIENTISKKRENILDSSQDDNIEEVRGTVDKMSKEDKETVEFRNKLEILFTRQEVYMEYPKYSLANMIASGYHSFALCYYKNDNRQTSVYYYGKTIIWLYEALAFEEKNGISDREYIRLISKRYEDIVLVSNDDIVKARSKKIYDAIQKIIIEK